MHDTALQLMQYYTTVRFIHVSAQTGGFLPVHSATINLAAT